MNEDDDTDKQNWGGTKAQFFDFFEIVAKHLKKCFPNLKIGGPALGWRLNWAEDFLFEMQKRGVALDFFSWHLYGREPEFIMTQAQKIRELLDKYGYTQTESICGEWNYVRGWTDEFVYSIEAIHGAKGASFMIATISEAQKHPIDMMMYYDTRPSVFNGVFDFYTYRTLKGYYALKWFGELYDYENEVRAINKIDDIYSIAGVDSDGKVIAIITHYSEDDTADRIFLDVDFQKKGKYEVYRVDSGHNGEQVMIPDVLEFEMPVHSMILIKEC